MIVCTSRDDQLSLSSSSFYSFPPLRASPPFSLRPPPAPPPSFFVTLVLTIILIKEAGHTGFSNFQRHKRDTCRPASMSRPLSYPYPLSPRYQLLEVQDPRKGANGGNGGKGGGAGVSLFAPSNRNTTTGMSGAPPRTMKPHEFGSLQFITPAQLRRRRQSRSLIRLFLIFTLCSVFLTLFRLYSLYTQQQAGRNTLSAKDHQLDTSTNITPPTLHLLIPITSPSLLFCKSLASSILTSYPPPVLINYNITFSQPAYARGAKLSGIADYLQSPFQLPNLPISNSDLVLIVDGFDVWYQLPPDILLHRYRGLFQQKSLHPHPAIFGADKLCWPNAASSAACTLAPESTLPRDAYGVNITDHDLSGYKVRPRFLNSGTVLGEWGVVRDIYNRAKEAAKRKKGQVWSDQGVLAEVWGAMLQQEIMEKTQDVVEMVIDYQSALFMTLTHAHTDLKWGLVSITTSPQTPYSISNNDFTASVDLTLKADFLPTSSLPKLNLATNIISHYIPALLHFNGPKFPLGNEKDAGWWGRMWWFHLSPDLQVAEGNAERAREFFLEKRSVKGGASGKKSGGVWTDRGEWLSWEQICGEWDHVGKGGIWWHT